MNPLGPHDPRPPGLAFQALFRRNALRPPDQEEQQLPEDRAELRGVEERTEKREARRGEDKEEKPAKKFRTPSFPLPQMPAPRPPRAQGFMLAPTPQAPRKQGREMQERELGNYSRWNTRETPGGALWIDDSGHSPDQATGEERDHHDPLEAMLCDPVGTPGRERLASWLAPFGSRVLTSCCSSGLKIRIRPQGPWGFEPDNSTLWAQLDQLEGFPEATLLGLARAFDAALGGGPAASRSALAVLTMLAQQPGCEPDDFFSQQLVRHVFQGGGRPLNDYLEYLIGPRIQE